MVTKFKRSRNGCNNCKKQKKKCDEAKPKCLNCEKRNIVSCDYNVVIRWNDQHIRSSEKSTRSIQKYTPIKKELPEDIVQTIDNNTVSDLVSLNSNIFISSPWRHDTNNSLHDFLNSFDSSSSLSPFDILPSYIHFPSSDILSHISIGSLHLPNPLPIQLSSSIYNMNLFDFYIKETSRLLTPTSDSSDFRNPFKYLITQMAMQSPTLLNILLAFGANHRNKKHSQIEDITDDNTRPYDSTKVNDNSDLLSELFPPLPSFDADMRTLSDSNNTSVVNEFLSKTSEELVEYFKNTHKRTDDTTLATILMLTLFDIFFGDKRRSWREHLGSAGKLIVERLGLSNKTAENQGNDNGLLKIILPHDTKKTRNFLILWFSYLDIVAALSSTNRRIDSETSLGDKPLLFKYCFKEDESIESNFECLRDRRLNLEDIERCIGVDPRVLSLMGDISTLIYFKIENEPVSQESLSEASELDYELQKYLRDSENERDIVLNMYNNNCSDELIEKLKSYKTLRATNLIFGLTGLLELKRRFFMIPTTSAIVNDILLKVTNLIDENIPILSCSTSCITFCLFCCGCDLLNPENAKYRHVYLERISQLGKIGVSSALTAKYIMNECWENNKNWWDVLREKDMDITFAI